MTVSYRQSPNPQEPEPLSLDAQPVQDSSASKGSEISDNLKTMLAPVRRKVVGKHALTSTSLDQTKGDHQIRNYNETVDRISQDITAPPADLNSSLTPTRRSTQFIRPPFSPAARPVQPVSANGENSPHLPQVQEPMAPERQTIALTSTHEYRAATPEIENANIILYRSHNFFLRTVYRPGQAHFPLRKPAGNTGVTPRVMPRQQTRIANSETRLMPNVALRVTKQTRALPLPTWLEAMLVLLFLVGTFIAHAYNLFDFPRYELDEGTYISNAWAITQGLISPYPYGYGHPPVAWMQIAAWMQLTGGPFTFGNSLNSGRVFMLFYTVGSALLVYLIVRRWTGSRSAALLALAIFSFSPLSITYQRQIFLDNIATFWLLLSLYLLTISRSRLFYLVLAAMSFGISVLSKEVFLISFPAMLYAVWLQTTRFQRKFTLVPFIYIVIAVCSGFVLMAVLKDELFPYAWHLPWDSHPHLSMLDTLVGQAQRGQIGGSFMASWVIWVANDPFFVFCSLAAPLFNFLLGIWYRRRLLLFVLLSLPLFRSSDPAFRRNLKVRDEERAPDKNLLISLLAISFWVLLARGGQVLSFYIIPLIPLVGMNVAIALNSILGGLGKLLRFDVFRAVLLIIIVIIIVPFEIKTTGFRFNQHPTSAQQQALVWIRTHVPHNAFIVMNSYMYLDLRLPGGQGIGDTASFPHAEVYWNAAYDPELRQQTLDNNPDRIDYIVTDSEMLHDIQTYGGQMDIIKQAYESSVPRAEFRASDFNLQIVIQVWQVIHKNPSPDVYAGPPTGTRIGHVAAISRLTV